MAIEAKDFNSKNCENSIACHIRDKPQGTFVEIFFVILQKSCQGNLEFE